MDDQLTRDSIVVECFDDFSALPDHLSRRFEFQDDNCIFSSIDWLACLQRHGFIDPPKIKLLVVSCDMEKTLPACMLCLIVDEQRNRLTSLTNYYSIHNPGILCSADSTFAQTNLLVHSIASEQNAWSEIDLRYLSAAEIQTGNLVSVLASAGYKVDLSHQYWNWYIDVSGKSYDTYLSERSSRLQNTLQRKNRIVASKFKLRIEIVQSISENTDALSDYQTVYSHSWKQAERPETFVSQIIQLCANLGLLRLGILYLDDIPVAAQFWITDRRVAYIYKLAHDERYAKHSVGTILSARMFEHAIDNDRVSEIDFGVGDEQYKREWVNSRRQIIGLQALNLRSVRGFFMYSKHVTRNVLRRIGLRKYVPVHLSGD